MIRHPDKITFHITLEQLSTVRQSLNVISQASYMLGLDQNASLTVGSYTKWISMIDRHTITILNIMQLVESNRADPAK